MMNFNFLKNKRLGFRTKLTIAMTLFASTSMLFVSLVIGNSSRTSMLSQEEDSNKGLLKVRGEAVQAYFDKLSADGKSISLSKFTQDAIVAYESIANATGVDLDSDNDVAKSDYYKNIEKKYEESFDDFLKSYNLENFSLVLNSGTVISQAMKTDLVGKNLKKGSLAKARIAECVQEVFGDRKKVGFRPFGKGWQPNKSASYLCVSIASKYDRDGYAQNDPMGVLVLHPKWSDFQKITEERSGMGETGEFLVWDSGGTPQNIPALSKDKFDFTAVTTGDSPLRADPKFLDASIGQNHFIEKENYNKVNVYSLFSKLTVLGSTWYMSAEVAKEEIQRPIKSMMYVGLAAFSIILVVLLFSGFFLARVMTKDMQAETKRLLDSMTRVEGVATTIRSVSDQLSGSSTAQAAAIQETSSAMEEISAMVEATEANIVKSSDMLGSCSQFAQSGKKEMDALVSAVGTIEEINKTVVTTMEQNNEKLKSLSSVISDIRNKTQIINDITFQTKLLSFNASVEAARAGEHGKGFAVVAEEVGNLARISQNAATEINQLIQNSVDQVSLVVNESMNSITTVSQNTAEAIQSGRSVANTCSSIFDDLLKSLQGCPLRRKNSPKEFTK